MIRSGVTSTHIFDVAMWRHELATLTFDFPNNCHPFTCCEVGCFFVLDGGSPFAISEKPGGGDPVGGTLPCTVLCSLLGAVPSPPSLALESLPHGRGSSCCTLNVCNMT